MSDRLKNIIGGAMLEDSPSCDNLAVALCTYFEGHMNRPENDPENEHGWGEWAEKKYQEAMDFIVKEVESEIQSQLKTERQRVVELEKELEKRKACYTCPVYLEMRAEVETPPPQGTEGGKE